ncbi:hypothetical protein RRG08_060060 [Elysia crispata]|uniref:SOCS box domain-containing protein n=1 Tax=Elysia crispata TaxID=231223 RepID=A0AAE0Y094_9GAST|nr:hypothetical protein RRG08_060060 [Elysia crispata]
MYIRAVEYFIHNVSTMTSRNLSHQRCGVTIINGRHDRITQEEEKKKENPHILSNFYSRKDSCLDHFLQTPHFNGSMFSNIEKPSLHHAIRCCPAAILPLVRAGCDIMATDTIHGDTPLHVACFYGLLDVAVFLMQRGACVNVLNNVGQTPLDKLLSLCQHPSKNSSTRSRLLTAHLLTRLGFKVNLKARGQHAGTRNRILLTYNKAKICSNCPSLLHISRLRVRALLPPTNVEPVVTSLPLPVDLQNFLLFRPEGLDRHVTCSHVEDLLRHFRSSNITTPKT